jgi:hypothetical protein
MAHFEIIEIGDVKLGSCLDAIRVICNPLEKQGAHVTVAGPFKNTPEPNGLQERVVGAKITVYGVGRFFEGVQNTVFLECDSPVIKKLWRKFGYAYRPHITLYDGRSRQFAEDLFGIASTFDLEFEFAAGRLVRIESAKGQQDFALRASLDYEFVERLVGEPVNMGTLLDIPPAIRLEFVGRILQFVSSTFRFGTIDISRRDESETASRIPPVQASLFKL